MSKLDPLEALMNKFDITGQTLAPPPLPGSRTAPASLPSVRPLAEAPASAASSSAVAVTSAAPAAAGQSAKRATRIPTQKEQLKHAISVNAAHVITHDYLTLSQPLSEGIMLMDRAERRLVMVRSLGELLPLRSYNTEYGNTLERVSKHKARLAGLIELDVVTDEADWDATLGRAALNTGSGAPRDAERMATYKAFATAAAAPAGAPAAANGGGEELSGPRLREKEAVEKMEALQMRMGEIERWFASVKAEAAGERQMREQAHSRALLLQERLERMQEQVAKLKEENAALRVRVADVGSAEPR